MSASLASRYPHAFVTGASAGLGLAFTEMLLREGVRVWGTSRDAGRLIALAQGFPALFTPVVLDLAQPVTAAASFERASQAAGGAFDLVINNAGYGVFGAFEETDFAVWSRQVEAMLTTTLQLAHLSVRRMRPRGRGCLVNVSSLAVEFPLPFMSGYNVAKAGLAALSESLVVETRGTGLTVIDFRPGDFRTAFNQSMHTLTPAAAAPSSRTAAAWRALEAHLAASPTPDLAARDLRRALLAGRSGPVRSGSFFQARIAPVFARLLPASVLRAASARYFQL